ncbi:MAG: hypothetical protein SOY42_10375 [Clostridium sp.]|nr:hypothetical protein [Clostridium sp.]
MGEFVKKNYKNFTYAKEEFAGLGFIENISQNSKEILSFNNIEEFIDLLINHIEKAKMIEVNATYQCGKCKAIKEEKCITIRHHREIEKINMYCKKCGIPMKLIKITNKYE